MIDARQNGYFEAFVNENAYRATDEDRRMMSIVQAAALAELPPGNVRWAGSVYKGTAIRGSDLDTLAVVNAPVTPAARLAFAKRIAKEAGRSARPLRHVVRVEPTAAAPRLDVAFSSTTTFGSRQAPDDEPFRTRRSRQFAVRALKLWTRRSALPRVPGWALETLVVRLDQQAEAELPLATFLRVIDWLAERADAANVLAIVKPFASPEWRAEWTGRLPGQVEALKNGARALIRTGPKRAPLASQVDIDAWLTGRR